MLNEMFIQSCIDWAYIEECDNLGFGESISRLLNAFNGQAF
jgi:hypothetical protein